MSRPQAPANLYQFLDPEELPHQILFFFSSPSLFLPFQTIWFHSRHHASMDATDFLERYRQLSTLDQQKNQLIEVHVIALILEIR